MPTPQAAQVILNPVTLDPLPPQEAIRFFKSKILLTAKEYYALSEKIRDTAFTVSRVAKMEILNDLYEAVQKAIDDGETLADFKERTKDIMTAKGWEGLEPWHEETIFRNNIQTSYSAGRWDQAQKVKDRFYARYDSVEDTRRSELCTWLDGKIFPIDHPFWDTWWPPNHHKCRSGITTVHKYAVDESKIETHDPTGQTVEVVNPVTGKKSKIVLQPAEGWGHNPGKTGFKPDLGKYPKELQEKYENDMRNKK